jgi:hypothetical protein
MAGGQRQQRRRIRREDLQIGPVRIIKLKYYQEVGGKDDGARKPQVIIREEDRNSLPDGVQQGTPESSGGPTGRRQ